MRQAAIGSVRICVVQSVKCWLAETENWIYRQIASLPKEIECHVVSETTANLEQYRVSSLCALDQLPWWRSAWDRGIRKLGLRRHLKFLIEQATRFEAAVLHSHFANIGWFNLEAAHRMRLKHVVTFYGYDVNYLPSANPRWRRRYTELFRSADRILCEGPHMAACLIKQGCPPQKIKVHHLGVEVDKIPFKPRHWDGKQSLRVLMAATFVEKKGIPYALTALAEIRKNIPVSITLIGDAHPCDKQQAEKRRIFDMIRNFQLDGCVRILGYVSHDRWLEELKQHHVFLAPSVTAQDGDTEGGLPVSLIEAAATGMPVVSTEHCDIPEVIRHRVTGLLAPERDAVGLAAQVRWLIDHRSSWLEMAESCRAHIEAEYNARKQGLRLAEIYADLVDEIPDS